MTEYYIRRSAERWKDLDEVYEVHKLGGGPFTVYHVWRAPDAADPSKNLRCDCPSGIHHPSDEVVCKHRRWVRQWLELDPARAWVVLVEGKRDDGRLVEVPMSRDLVEGMMEEGALPSSWIGGV